MKAIQPIRRLAPAFLLAALAACDGAGLTVPGQGADHGTRFIRAGADSIAGQYIVVFEADPESRIESTAHQIVSEHGGAVQHRFTHALRGFSATLSPEAVEALLRDPRVAYVAQDGLVELATTQTPATWGLDRIDQRSLPRNNAYNYTPTGAGVTAYVIDTGILTTHVEFGGRATVGVDLVGDGQNGQDCHGHGTHVAGTVGGTTYGVAKGVSLVAVRIFNCAGSSVPNSTIIAAVDWVTANGVKPAVVNMSLGGGVHAPTNQAVATSIDSGFVYVVAAGNENQDACLKSPASTPTAITVASSDSADVRSGFSNWGSCTDLFAPGSLITSAWFSSPTATNTISGTSMATPHVAGVAALYLQGNPAATPAAVGNAILTSATTGKITDLVGSPNRLLFSPLTPEVLSLNTSALNLTVVRPPAGVSAAVATAAAGGTRFTASASGATKFEGPAPAGGEATIASTSATGQVTLTNGTGGSVPWTSSSSDAWLTASPPERYAGRPRQPERQPDRQRHVAGRRDL